MPTKTLFIVQQFERSGKRLIAGRVLDFRKAEEAVARAERASITAVGVRPIIRRRHAQKRPALALALTVGIALAASALLRRGVSRSGYQVW